MNKLPSSVRSSLIDKALTGKKRQWSLKSLAAMSKAQPPSNETSDNSSGTSISWNNSTKRRPGPSSSVADTLLSDVNIRLAGQHKKCLDMIEQISGKTASALEKPVTNTTGPKIIRAVNQPVQGVSFKEWIDGSQKVESAKGTILRSLNDLEMLHADTFSITEHLLSNDKPTIKRFSNADQSVLAATFEQVRTRHASTVENMADIVLLMRSLKNIDHGMKFDDQLVDNFLRDRLGTQLLCDHYVGLSKGKAGGGISVNCKFKDVLTDAILESKHVCDANYGIAPEVHILDDNLGNYEITLIRPWVDYILCELLKNGMTSSVQKASSEGKSAMPPDMFVRIHHNESQEMLVCEILDQGIGINETGLERAFMFAESSSQRRWDRIDEQQSYAMVTQPITSLGVGLSLSKMMAQMFGGSVQLENRMVDIDHSNVRIGKGCSSTVYLSTFDETECDV